MTNLPVDYENRPWKSKYLTEETPVLNNWFIFGDPATQWTVDITDGTQDIFVNIPRDIAVRLVEARQAMVDEIEKWLCNSEEER